MHLVLLIVMLLNLDKEMRVDWRLVLQVMLGKALGVGYRHALLTFKFSRSASPPVRMRAGQETLSAGF